MKVFFRSLIAVLYLLAATTAQANFIINSFISFPSGGGGGVTTVAISTEASQYTATNATTFTITAGSIGAADTNRWLAVAAATRGSSGATRTISALTIGGTTFDFIDKRDGIVNPCVIGLFHITTGTTADIVATWSGAVDGIGLQVYRFLSSAADPRNVAALSTSAQSPTGTQDVAEGGAVIACTSGENANDPTFTGVTKSSSVAVNGSGAGGEWVAAARTNDLTVETGRTITATVSQGTTQLLAISVKPN